MKYKELTGICKDAIHNGWCTGCNKLEEYNFTGVKSCKYVDIEREKHPADICKIDKTIMEYQQLKI